MTVLINATSAKMGGALTYLGNLATALDGAPNIQAVIAVSDAVSLPPLARVRIHRVPRAICSSGIRLFLWQQLVLRSLIRRYHCTVLFSSANFCTFFCPVPQIVLIRIPHYFSLEYQKYILPRKSRRAKLDFHIRSLLIALSMRASRHVLFQTESSRSDAMRRHEWLSKKATSSNWFGTTIAVERSEPPLGKLVKLFSSSHYSDYKNYTTLLCALMLLAKDATLPFRFTAPIDPSLPLFRDLPSAQSDRDLIHSPELAGHLNLTGPLPYGELSALYSEADIFLWPSLAETFGQPLIEAMQSGLPIICSDIPVHREICGQAALYVPPLDSRAWARTIHELSGSAELRQSLSAKARERSHLFSWEAHFQRLRDLFYQYARTN